MGDIVERRRRAKRTWSALGELGRTPSEYEVVTHGMNHTSTRPLPLEMGPDTFGNQYLIAHQRQIALRVDDWNAFRDPDEVTYRKFNRMQDEAETFVDRVIEEYAGQRQADLDHTPAWLEALGLLLTPQRYPVHGLQMLAAYVQQLAPSSYLGNAAAFQTADELRRVQRLAQRTRQLQLAHPRRGFGERDLERWETDPLWQGARRGIERALVARDWDEAFVALNLSIKPAFDAVYLAGLARVARQHGDQADALLLDNLTLDSQRSARWSEALVRFAVASQADNAEKLRRMLAAWRPLADEVLGIGGAALSRCSADGRDAGAVVGGRAALDRLAAPAAGSA